MKDPVLESLNTIRALESAEILNEAAVAAPAAVASKGIGRFIPGVGAALGAYDAYGRAKQGDWAGAGLSALGGAASLIPGVGTAASLGIAGAQALRDKQRTGSYMPGEDEIAAAVAKDAAPQAVTAKPAAAPAMTKDQIIAFQKANGLTPDGIIGPKTQAALNAQKTKGTAMSETQKIAELRDRLAQLEQAQPQVADEGIGDLAKGIWNTGKAAVSGAKWGAANPNLTNRLVANPGVANATGVAAAKTAGAMARNPVKTAVGAAAAGAGTMAALGGGAATKPADPVKPTVKPTTKPAVTAPAAPTFSPEDEQNLAFLGAELEKQRGKNSELDALLDLHKELRSASAGKEPEAPE